jgi:hypothetical protein
MRAKFVSHADLQADPTDLEPYTYPIDPLALQHAEGSLSALADILMTTFRPEEILHDLPQSFHEWRSGIADTTNLLTEWLQEQTVVTGDRTDMLLLKPLKDACTVVKPSAFYGLAKAYFESRNCKFLDVTNAKNGPTVRNVIRGAKLVEDAPPVAFR